MATTRRFEFTDARSHKFWEITVTGKKVTVRYGRIGTEGQTQVKAHATPAEAKAAAEKQVTEKVKKGYREVGAQGAAKAPPKAPAGKTTTKKAAKKAAPTKSAAPSPAAGEIAGKTFLFTGTLTTMTRAEAEQLVEAQGGSVLSGVSDKLDYLVVGEKAGGKLAKARKIPSITILTEDQFRALARDTAPASSGVTPLSKRDLMQQLWTETICPLLNSEFEIEVAEQVSGLIELEWRRVKKLPGGILRIRIRASDIFVQTGNQARSDFFSKFETDALAGNQEHAREDLEEWIATSLHGFVTFLNDEYIVLNGTKVDPEAGEYWENPHTICIALKTPTVHLTDLNPAWNGARFLLDDEQQSSFRDAIAREDYY